MSMSWEGMTLTGRGRVARAPVKAYTPQRAEDIRAAVAAADDHGVLACGRGRSYGDVGLNGGGRAVLTAALDRIRSFDPATGRVVCEPGVAFRQLLDAFLPRGYMAPVTPGTAFVSVGGAVANDVHGKNHDFSGSFGDHVEWIDLLLPGGETTRVSPAHRPDLFAATIGGIGLTGIMLAVCFKLLKVPSNAMRVRQERIADIDAFLARLEEVRRSATYSIGWIDALARGGKQGRGVLMTGEPSPDGVPAPARRCWKVGFDAPPLLLNPWTLGAFNELYYRRVPKAGRERLVHVEGFFYPLDAVRDWNRLYGRRGFYQFQCVLPDAERGGIRRLLREAARWRVGAALATLKTLGSAGRGHLSFPMRGYTLALEHSCYASPRYSWTLG